MTLDYNKIDVPVFAASARDYIRITGQVQDEDPGCFSTIEETSVPALQEWCQRLTVLRREKAARSFFRSLKHLGDSVEQYLQVDQNVAAADRDFLRERIRDRGTRRYPQVYKEGE